MTTDTSALEQQFAVIRNRDVFAELIIKLFSPNWNCSTLALAEA
jgi:hypothetical protein